MVEPILMSSTRFLAVAVGLSLSLPASVFAQGAAAETRGAKGEAIGDGKADAAVECRAQLFAADAGQAPNDLEDVRRRP